MYESDRGRINLVMIMLWLLAMLTNAEASQSYNATLNQNITSLLNNLLKNNYDPKFRPFHGGPPVEIGISLEVLSMGPVSEKDMTFSLDCYFRQKWFDPRLKFDGPIDPLALAQKVLTDIWRPDTYIKNGKQSYLHKITTPNILIRVYQEGKVYISQSCPMFLRKFPMDTQACGIIIGSLGYTKKDVVYRWFAIDGDIKKMSLSQYKVLDHIRDEQNISDIRHPDGEKISVLRVYFLLERQQGYYLLQMYTPCSLIVVMSWVSFWINKEASPARVSLGIMTVLTMSSLSLGGRDGLPKVGYSTALDIFLVVCFGMVFGALIEYAVINFAHIFYVRKTVQEIRKRRNKSAMAQLAASMLGGGGKKTDSDNEEIEETKVEENHAEPRLTQVTTRANHVHLSPSKSAADTIMQGLCCRRRRRPTMRRRTTLIQRAKAAKAKLTPERVSEVVDKIDTASKFMFPFVYMTFNALYWMAYLYWIEDEIKTEIPVIQEHLRAKELMEL